MQEITRKQEYFFAILSDCESRILKLGTPLRCRVIQSIESGRPDSFHIGTENSERFVRVSKPKFSKIREAQKLEVISPEWRHNLKSQAGFDLS